MYVHILIPICVQVDVCVCECVNIEKRQCELPIVRKTGSLVNVISV